MNLAETNYTYSSNGEGRKVKYSITVTFDSKREIDSGLLAHEGQHVSDVKDALEATVVRHGRYATPSALNLNTFQREIRVYESQQNVARLLHQDYSVSGAHGSIDLWKESWDRIDANSSPTYRDRMVLKRIEAAREVEGVTLNSPGRTITRPVP